MNVLTVSGETLAQAADFTSLLLQTLEKAVAQSSQHALLAEGVAASVLLSRLAMLETQTGDLHFLESFRFLCQVEHSEDDFFGFLFLQKQSSPASGTSSWMRKSHFLLLRSSSTRQTMKVGKTLYLLCMFSY